MQKNSQNMQQYIKICRKYAKFQNMQKNILIFASFIVFLEVLSH